MCGPLSPMHARFLCPHGMVDGTVVAFLVLLTVLVAGIIGAGVYLYFRLEKRIKAKCESSDAEDVVDIVATLGSKLSSMAQDTDTLLNYYHVKDPVGVLKVNDVGDVVVRHPTNPITTMTLGDTNTVSSYSDRLSVMHRGSAASGALGSEVGMHLRNNRVDFQANRLDIGGQFAMRINNDTLEICKRDVEGGVLLGTCKAIS